MGPQDGGAGGYCTVWYKSGTNSQRQRPEPLHCVPTVSQQWGGGGDYLWTAWLTTFPKLQVSYIKYLDISWEISGIGYFSLAKGQGSSFRGRTSQLWTSVRPLSIRREDWGVPLAPPACIQQVSGRLQLQVHISISRNPWASTAPSPTPNEMTKTNAFWQQSCVCVCPPKVHYKLDNKLHPRYKKPWGKYYLSSTFPPACLCRSLLCREN